MHRTARRLLALLLILSSFQLVFALPNAQACPEPRLTIGGQGQVLPGSPNRVRDAASTAGSQVGEIPGGSTFIVFDGPICAEGYNWWQVDYEGLVGFTVEGSADSYFVEPVVEAVEPSATAVPPSSDTACPTDVAPAPRLVAGTFGVVISDNPIRLRAEASTSAEQLSLINPNFQFIVLDGPVCAEGYNWWHVEDEGVQGWIAEGSDGDYFVEPVGATSTPLPSRTFLPTSAPTNTRTPTITPTPSNTPTATNTPLPLYHPRSVSISADGALLAVGNDNGIYLFDTSDYTVEPIHLGDAEQVQLVRFSPTDPNLLLTSPTIGVIYAWDVEAQEVVYDLVTEGAVTSLSFSADGSRFVVVSSEYWTVYDTETHQIIAEQATGLEEPQAALNSDGAMVVYSDVGEVNAQNVIYTLTLESEEPPQTYDRETIFAEITAVAFTPDDAQVLLADIDGNIQMWHMETLERTSFIRSTEESSVSTRINALAFHPTEELLVTAESGVTGVVRVFNWNSLTPTDTYGADAAYSGGFFDAAYSTDGSLLALSANNDVRVLDTSTYDDVALLIMR